MPIVRTSLGNLFVDVRGSGPPVSFWHCFLGDASIWAAPITAIQEHTLTINVEGPAHGRSDPCRRRFTLEECADAWIQVLDFLGIREPAVLCGLSWGSMVASRVALRYPHRTRALALFGTIASGVRSADMPKFMAFSQTIRWLGIPDWLVRQLVPTLVSRATQARAPNLARDFLLRTRRLDRQGLAQCALEVLVRRSDIVDQLWRVQIPTTVVVGRKDLTTPPNAARLVAKAIEGAKLREVEDVGHLLPLEAPDACTEHLVDLLRDCDL